MREICKSCGKVTRHYAKGICHKCYASAYQRTYSKTPERRAWRKTYEETPSFKKWAKAYSKTEAYRISHARYYLKTLSLKARLKLFEEVMEK